MFDDLSAYFYENVITTYNVFVEAIKSDVAGISNDLRATINSATILYHLREHIPNSKSKSMTAIACPDYNLLGDIVNASKHKNLTKGNPQVNSAKDIYEQLEITEYKDNEGKYFNSRKKVVVRLKNGSERDVLEILTNVLSYWIDELYSINVIKDKDSKKILFKENKNPIGRKEANKRHLNLEALQGIRFKLSIKLQKYNYDTGNVEPINLTGSKLLFHMYRPSILELRAKNNKTGEIIKREIKLTKENFGKFAKLESDRDKQEFLSKVAQEQGMLDEIIKQIQKAKK